ncbi:hypothetical protein [Pantoea sp. BL1]|uniref:hypothetical protein n=1 Tax=Pantoea sp. BL1 TaxID=1628190 RepID=UPI0006978C53|nr:hypothetical protein [Pantoea sp. BL1]
MNTLVKNAWSSAGMIFGALALIISLIHFSTGPYSASPSLESVVARHVSEIKKGVIDGLKGKAPSSAESARKINIDQILTTVALSFATAALLLAFVGGMRKENKWSVRGALIFGCGTLAFHAILLGMALASAIILLLILLSLISGFFG